MTLLVADDLYRFFHVGETEVRALRGASLRVDRGEACLAQLICRQGLRLGKSRRGIDQLENGITRQAAPRSTSLKSAPAGANAIRIIRPGWR